MCVRPYIKYTDDNGTTRYHYFSESSADNDTNIVNSVYYTSLSKVASYMKNVLNVNNPTINSYIVVE